MSQVTLLTNAYDQLINILKEKNNILLETIETNNKADKIKDEKILELKNTVLELEYKIEKQKKISQKLMETNEMNTTIINNYKNITDINTEIIEIHKDKNQNLRNIIYNMIGRIQSEISFTWEA